MDNLASEAQRKMFFGLSRDLGMEANVAKERASKKFNLDSFTKITSSQISSLIDAMQKLLHNTPHKHHFVCTKCKVNLELVFIDE